MRRYQRDEMVDSWIWRFFVFCFFVVMLLAGLKGLFE